MEFKNVTVIKAANVYFDGKVTSRTVHFRKRREKDTWLHVGRGIRIQYRC